MLFIQYFDAQKQERCGSDFYWIPDQRKSVRTMCVLAHETPNQRKYENGERKLEYFRVVSAANLLSKFHYMTDFIRV